MTASPSHTEELRNRTLDTCAHNSGLLSSLFILFIALCPSVLIGQEEGLKGGPSGSGLCQLTSLVLLALPKGTLCSLGPHCPRAAHRAALRDTVGTSFRMDTAGSHRTLN